MRITTTNDIPGCRMTQMLDERFGRTVGLTTLLSRSDVIEPAG